jgi:hypothetical protein
VVWSYGSDIEDFVLELVEKREPHITICSCMRALSREEHTCVLVYGFLFRVLSNGVRTKGYTWSYNLFEEEKEDRHQLCDRGFMVVEPRGQEQRHGDRILLVNNTIDVCY